jgi:outer membrane protein assembly factor BamA
VIAFTGLRLGQTAGKEELETARQRLMDTGFFGSAGFQFKPGPSGKGIAVTFQLDELAETYPIRFERLPAASDELRAHLKDSDPLYRDRIPASPALLERYAQSIEAFLASRGKTLQVAGRLWPDRSNELAVVFSPAARAPAIAQVQFTGSKAISAEDLQAAIAPVAIGAAFTEEDFRAMLDATVRKLYEAKGMLRVEFPRVTPAPAEGIDGVAVLVEVAEGDVYTLNRVAIQGAPLPEAELLKAAALKTGGPANFDEVREGLERLRARLGAAGFLKPELRVERVLHDADRQADVVIHVESGPRFSMGKLTVVGLNLDGEAQIRRLWALKPGEPFNSTYADYFLSRVREDGVFDNLGAAKASLAINETAGSVDVTLTFSGQPPPPKEPSRRRPGW